MSNTTQSIDLTTEELITLIKKRTLKKNGIRIDSNSSFLAVLALLYEEMAQRMPYAKLR